MRRAKGTLCLVCSDERVFFSKDQNVYFVYETAFGVWKLTCWREAHAGLSTGGLARQRRRGCASLQT